MSKAVNTLEPGGLFRWETMREVSAWTLNYQQPIHGQVVEVQLISGHKVLTFRAEDLQFYFCHGLTFGGKMAPGGALSPFSGKEVRTILDNHYQLVIPEAGALRGDIVVWKGLGDDTPHSAFLTEPIVAEGKSYLEYSSQVRTKNGRLPEAEMALDRLTGDEFNYGDSFQVFRRR